MDSNIFAASDHDGIFDISSLSTELETFEDKRRVKGKYYSLALVLLLHGDSKVVGVE